MIEHVRKRGLEAHSYSLGNREDFGKAEADCCRPRALCREYNTRSRVLCTVVDRVAKPEGGLTLINQIHCQGRSNTPIRMSTFFSPGGVEELYPKLVGLSLEELSTVVEPFGSGIVGPPIDE